MPYAYSKGSNQQRLFMHMNKNIGEYRNLSDLPLITTLHYFGIREEAIEKDNHGKSYFNFWITKEVDELTRKFYAGQLLVDPAAFALHLRATKNQIYRQGL